MEPNMDQPEYTREQEAAIERADREADRAFDAGDADCAAWLAKYEIGSEEDQVLLLRHFICDSLDERTCHALATLRWRLYSAWTDHCRERALSDLADEKENAAINKAEQKYDERRIRGLE